MGWNDRFGRYFVFFFLLLFFLIFQGYSVDEAKIGSKDGYINDAYRTILSFDTSDVPINATIKKATLRLYRKKMDGNVNLISIDLKAGSYGDDSTLVQSDY